MNVHEARAAQAAPHAVDGEAHKHRRHIWQGLAGIPTAAVKPWVRLPPVVAFHKEQVRFAFDRIHMRLATDDTILPSEASDIRFDAQRAAQTLFARIDWLFQQKQIPPREYWELQRDIDLFRGVEPDAALFIFEIHLRRKS